MSTSTFHPFPLLPFELRELIWTCCLPTTPRLIDLHVPSCQPDIDNTFNSIPSQKRTPAPVLAYISRESRSFLLRTYSLKLNASSLTCGYSNLFINLQTDTFIVPWYSINANLHHSQEQHPKPIRALIALIPTFIPIPISELRSIRQLIVKFDITRPVMQRLPLASMFWKIACLLPFEGLETFRIAMLTRYCETTGERREMAEEQLASFTQLVRSGYEKVVDQYEAEFWPGKKEWFLEIFDGITSLSRGHAPSGWWTI